MGATLLFLVPLFSSSWESRVQFWYVWEPLQYKFDIWQPLVLSGSHFLFGATQLRGFWLKLHYLYFTCISPQFGIHFAMEPFVARSHFQLRGFWVIPHFVFFVGATCTVLIFMGATLIQFWHLPATRSDSEWEPFFVRSHSTAGILTETKIFVFYLYFPAVWYPSTFLDVYGSHLTISVPFFLLCGIHVYSFDIYGSHFNTILTSASYSFWFWVGAIFCSEPLNCGDFDWN